MPDNAVLIGDGWMTWLRRGAVALVIVCLTLVGVYTTIRIRVIYHLQHELVRLQSEVEVLQQANLSSFKMLSDRLDDMERVLFGDVVTKLAKAPPGPNRVELWQRNRDAELRGRILTLEKRLMRIEHLISERKTP